MTKDDDTDVEFEARASLPANVFLAVLAALGVGGISGVFGGLLFSTNPPGLDQQLCRDRIDAYERHLAEWEQWGAQVVDRLGGDVPKRPSY